MSDTASIAIEDPAEPPAPGDVIDTKTVRASIAPLISGPDVLRKTFRTRSSQFIQKSVHIADIDEEQAAGWQLLKKRKRSATVQKRKPISRMLEDRFWCLCQRMGYPIMNGEALKVSYTRQNGTHGAKQIDVFAKDAETVIIAECKTRENRGRKTLQKDLHETGYLQKPIADAIRAHFGNGFKPKIVWLYVTENIIWSEPDVQRADELNIRIVNENQLQYFETYIDHVGTAGRYQFLAEFLQGQDIPGLQGVKIPATKGKLGKETFYSFVVPAETLLKVAFVNHHALNNVEGRPAYQRMIDKKRLSSIGDYIKSGGYFPTNILVNFTQKCNFEPIAKEDNQPEGLTFGHLIFPNKFKSAWVIDGQHRLFGFTNLPEEYLQKPLFVLGFEKMDTAQEAELFITINHKQKSVPKSLLAALQADLQMGSDDADEALSALASFLIRKLSSDTTSPLSGRFQVPGVPASELQTLTIPEVQKGLKKSQLIGRVLRKNRMEGYLSGKTDDQTLNRARTVINGYFDMVEKATQRQWDMGRGGFVVTNPGVRAHLMLMGEALRYLDLQQRLDPYGASAEQLIGNLKSFLLPLFEWLERITQAEYESYFARKYGEGGVREYLFKLCEVVNKAYPQFGSDEFQRYIENSKDERNAQAQMDVEDMTRLITMVVIETLKRVYGTDEMPSGEKRYWELGITDMDIKQSAYKAQQETKPEKRRAKEAYLFLMQFEKIIKQKGNWEHFKPIFNIPFKNDNPKAKEYHLGWLEMLNEVRRVTAHPSPYRTLDDEDHQFLAWLKGELYERCQAAGFEAP